MSEPLALITGAGRGIGKAIALRLAQAHIPVVLVARSSDEISDVRNQIFAAGGEAWACPCDVTEQSEVDALRNDIASEVGTVNILINNAGVAPSAKLEDTTDEMWRETFAVNVDGAFHTIRAFAPAMKAEGGHIVAIASTAALRGYRFTSAYTASKHALLGLMRAVSEEMRNTEVKFSTICPGFTRTRIVEESIRNLVARGKTAGEAEAAYAGMNDEGRLIEPQEIAETVYRIITNSTLSSGREYDANGTVIGQ